MNKACSAYRPGSLCTNGFPMKYPASSACTGTTCVCCGTYNNVIPSCQDDNIPLPWLNEDGTPKNYKGGVE